MHRQLLFFWITSNLFLQSYVAGFKIQTLRSVTSFKCILTRRLFYVVCVCVCVACVLKMYKIIKSHRQFQRVPYFFLTFRSSQTIFHSFHIFALKKKTNFFSYKTHQHSTKLNCKLFVTFMFLKKTTKTNLQKNELTQLHLLRIERQSENVSTIVTCTFHSAVAV